MTSNKADILVIDDTVQIRRLLTSLLNTAGYSVRSAGGGREGLDAVSAQLPDLIILDMLMPDMSGLEVCRSLRSWYVGPILFLTVSTSDHTIVAALDAGGDDYLTKPFSSGELLARVRALLRRAQQSATLVPTITIGDLCIDLAHRAVSRGSAVISLTPTEYDLLALLAQHIDGIVTQQEILSTVWGDDDAAMLPTLRMHISNLRKKVQPSHAERDIIETLPCVGYRLHTTLTPQ